MPWEMPTLELVLTVGLPCVDIMLGTGRWLKSVAGRSALKLNPSTKLCSGVASSKSG
jgi:hypothetical protein